MRFSTFVMCGKCVCISNFCQAINKNGLHQLLCHFLFHKLKIFVQFFNYFFQFFSEIFSFFRFSQNFQLGAQKRMWFLGHGKTRFQILKGLAQKPCSLYYSCESEAVLRTKYESYTQCNLPKIVSSHKITCKTEA